jgi:polyisoprenyl-teichoic acid--peptidoglycan teichoic acid transferase
MLNNKAALQQIVFLALAILLLIPAVWLSENYDSITSKRTAQTAAITRETEEAADEEYTYTPPLSEQYYNLLLLGVDQEGMADVIVVVSVNFFSDLIVITSISRDTYVAEQNWAEEGAGGSHLSFASYVGMGAGRKDYLSGAATTAYWVEELFGLVIHDYALVTHEGFIALIDLIGGVEIDVNPAFTGRQLDLFGGKKLAPLPTGLQRLEGAQAFAFSRYRGGSEEKRIAEPGSGHDEGDRIIRNQQLLKSIYRQLKSLKTSQLLNILKEAPQYVHTSINLWDLATMVPKLQQANFGEIITIVIPGELSPQYEDKAGRDVYYYFVDYETTAALLSGLGLIWDETQ